jgi:hypothetical protein
MKSQGLGYLRKPAFIEIDEVGNRENVGPTSDAELLFPLLQSWTERIAPSEFRYESIPDEKVTFIRPPTALETPLKDLFVGPALAAALAQIVIVDTQEITASAIKRSRRTEVLVIILLQLAAGMLPNFVQHAREIHHAARHFLRAFWISRHIQINAALCGNAILARLSTEN